MMLWLTVVTALYIITGLGENANAADSPVDGNWIPRDEFEARLAQLENRLAVETSQRQQEITLLKDEVTQLRSENRQLRSVMDRQRSMIQRSIRTASGSDSPANKDDGVNNDDEREPILDDAEASPMKERSTRIEPRQLGVGSAYGIAFTVNLGGSNFYHLGLAQTIKFDHIISNHGNDYDARTGVFTTRVPGWYVVSLMAAFGDGEMELWVVKDGSMLVKCWDRETAGLVDTVTQTAVVHLEAGSQIWVQTHPTMTMTQVVAGDHHTTFTGFLLYQD